MRYRVFIDESGEAGIVKVRENGSPGASPYFVLGAAVFQHEAEADARKVVHKFKESIGKTSWKHATDLNHQEKVYLGRLLGRLPVRYFAVISNKSTLTREYKEMIADDPQKFYNKCVQYLLEIILAYLAKHVTSSDEIDVVFERRNHNYGRMISFFNAIKKNPIYPQSKSFKLLNPYSIVNKKKGEELLLEVADFVSHAVYQLANKTDQNFHIPEKRYFEELMSRFAGDAECKILDTGLKCIHELDALALDPEIKAFLKSAKCSPPAI